MQHRNNQDWLQELKGDCGVTRQADAHRDLASYLYVVAYNYLRLRQADLRALAVFPDEELAALAQDFVQETLEKLARPRLCTAGDLQRRGQVHLVDRADRA